MWIKRRKKNIFKDFCVEEKEIDKEEEDDEDEDAEEEYALRKDRRNEEDIYIINTRLCWKRKH